MAITTKFNELVPELGTVRFPATFTDDAGIAAVPNTLTWTLTDSLGNVINSRDGVSVSPAATVTIVLTGADLAIGTNGRNRHLLLEGTYDSDAGNGLALKSEAVFTIHDFVGV